MHGRNLANRTDVGRGSHTAALPENRLFDADRSCFSAVGHVPLRGLTGDTDSRRPDRKYRSAYRAGADIFHWIQRHLDSGAERCAGTRGA